GRASGPVSPRQGTIPEGRFHGTRRRDWARATAANRPLAGGRLRGRQRAGWRRGRLRLSWCALRWVGAGGLGRCAPRAGKAVSVTIIAASHCSPLTRGGRVRIVDRDCPGLGLIASDEGIVAEPSRRRAKLQSGRRGRRRYTWRGDV